MYTAFCVAYLAALIIIMFVHRAVPFGMAATFEFEEDNGAATGTPAKGATRTAARAEVNWKNIDDSTTAYSSAPVTAGNNSFDKWQFGHFSGTYNQILAGLFAHTAGTLGTGLTLKGKVAPSGGYTTPSVNANANLTVDMTTAIAIGSGQAVQFGATGPEAAGKGASTTANPAYSEWLVTQMQTSALAAPNDTGTQTLTLEYAEN
jgi:hypothetical protein